MMIYIIFFVSCIISIYINHMLYYTISLILFNLSVYSYIYVKPEQSLICNYRNVFNYIIISCICYYIYLLSILYFNTWLYFTITSITIVFFIKLVMYPYVIWALPVYENLPMIKFMLIAILTKLIYGYWILYFNLLPSTYFILIITFIISACMSVNVYYTLLLIVISSTFQMTYICILYFNSIYYLTILYWIFYAITWYLLYYSLTENLSISYRIILFMLIYTYVGIPPFFGFYLKVFTFSSLISAKNVLVIIIICTIITTYMYINLYNRPTEKAQHKINTPKIVTILCSIIMYILPIPFDVICMI